MSDIQRWHPKRAPGMSLNPEGGYVTYADHVAALAQAEQRITDQAAEVVEGISWNKGYEQGQRDVLADKAVFTHDTLTDLLARNEQHVLAAAVQRVEELRHPICKPFDPPGAGHGEDCNCTLYFPKVIAAIKGES